MLVSFIVLLKTSLKIKKPTFLFIFSVYKLTTKLTTCLICSNYFTDNIQNELYDDVDLDRIRTQDLFVRGYLRHQNGDIAKAASMVDTSLQWRKRMDLNSELSTHQVCDRYSPHMAIKFTASPTSRKK